MTRTPIISRTPIIDTGETFQTIASLNKEYEPCFIMGTYPTIDDARKHYQDDMKGVQDKGYKHFAIRKVVEEAV